MLRATDVLIYLGALRPSDVLDITLVALLVLALLVVVRGSTAVRLLRGILIASLLLLLVSEALDLPAFAGIIARILPSALVAVPVIFQPELRRAFERLGRTGFFGPSVSRVGDDWIQATAAACRRMAEAKVGALIVVQRRISLSEFIDRGLVMDAVCSSDLLLQVFVPNSPLHDGAVILSEGRLKAARVVLPLGAATGGIRNLGTRHMAALNISRLTDALALVVSEETGVLSIAQDGRLTRRLTEHGLMERLREAFRPAEAPPARGWFEIWSQLRGLGRAGDAPQVEAAAGEPRLTDKLKALRAALRRLPLRGRPSEMGLALVVALLWWLAVQTDARPLVEQVLPAAGAEARLDLQFDIADADLAAYRRDDVAIQLRLRGLRSALEGLDTGTLVAIVKVPNEVGGGAERELPVQGRCRSRWQCWRKGIRVVGSQPNSLTLGLGGLVVDERPVSFDAGQVLPPRLRVEQGRSLPATVQISGAAAQVSRVAVLRATLPELALSPGPLRVGRVPVLPLDAFGAPVHDLRLAPSEVAVELVLAESGEPVAVSPRWRIAPADGYEIYGVEVDPESIQLEGESAAVEQVRQRGFKPLVDLTELTEDTIKRFALDLPADVRALGGVEAITVSLKVRAQTGTRSLTLSLLPINLPEGLLAEPAAETLQAVLEGPRPLLDALDPADVSAELDLRGLAEGTHRIAPTLSLPVGVSTRGLAPATIEVTLRRAEEAPSP